MRRAVVAAAVTAGCVLDFEAIRVRRGDAGAPVDIVVADVPAPKDRPSITPDLPGTDVAHPDVPTPPDVSDPCAPAEARLRVAHMATGFGPVRLCMRRVPGAWASVNDPVWPVGGVREAQVSASISTTQEVSQQNEPWSFALIPVEAGCASITVTNPPLAALSAQLDPGDRATLLFTSQESSQGRLVGVLGLLLDKVCTDCPPNSLDIRMVHAALGAATSRLEFAINYVMPGGRNPPLVNVFFAQNVGYGGTAPVGDRGFDCDSAWYFGSLLPAGFPIGLSAFEVGGDAVADSERFSIKGALINRARLATVYFHGDWVQRGERPEFLLCYEGVEESGLTVCDRVPGNAVARVDAGDPDAAADASVDDARWPDDAGAPVSDAGDAGDDVIDATAEMDAPLI